MINDWIGLLHLLAAVVAFISGTLVLGGTKGILRHKKIGYVYAMSMLLVVLTAFGIYRLFAKFGPFHAFALLSIFSLALGILPMLRREKTGKILRMHYSRMYWSVIGLYGAFAAELLVRLSGTPFWGGVIFSVCVILLIGGIFFRKYLEGWENSLLSRKEST